MRIYVMKTKLSRRKCVLFIIKFIFMSTFSGQAHAGLDYACWTDPLAVMVLTSGRLASHSISPVKGVHGRLFFDESLGGFLAYVIIPVNMNGITYLLRLIWVHILSLHLQISVIINSLMMLM